MATISEALSIAIAQIQAGQNIAAQQILQRILQVDPQHADAWYYLAVIAFQAKDYDQAETCMQRVLESRPHAADAYHFLGIILKHAGKLDQAIVNYRKTLAIDPADAEAYNNLGIVLAEQGQATDAIACYRQAVALSPNYAKALNNLGVALHDTGQLEEAVACYQAALKNSPKNTACLNNLGTLFAELGRSDEAIQCYRRVLELEPEFSEAYLNLGNVFQRERRLEEALESYQRALQLNANLCDAYIFQGHVLHDLGRSDEAFHCFVEALNISPDYVHALAYLLKQMQYACRWEGIEKIAGRIIELFEEADKGVDEEKAPPFVFLALPVPTNPAQQLRFARAYGRQFIASPLLPLVASQREEKGRLTIGFASADFRQHPVASHLVEMIELFDRDRFRIVGYAFGPDDESEVRQRLVRAFDQFVDIQPLSHREAAEHIAQDNVDILVDLMGYTNHARTNILALRPAPIQVNYLGYPGTLGLPFVDYILADDYLIPPDHHAFYSEKVVYLPGCMLPSPSSADLTSSSPKRSDFGLPENGFVFCCFNSPFKITAAIFDCWMHLLKSVPESVLWLLEGNKFAPANLKREALARGVSSDRLIFSPRLSSAMYMSRYLQADLFLDTPIYNGHSTASEALKMGCPVLTISGQTFASRVAGSMLRVLNLDELITETIEEYSAKAYRLATNPTYLSKIREKLAHGRTHGPLFDSRLYTSHIESAFERMWQLHVAGRAPEAFAVPSRSTVTKKPEPSERA